MGILSEEQPSGAICKSQGLSLRLRGGGAPDSKGKGAFCSHLSHPPEHETGQRSDVCSVHPVALAGKGKDGKGAHPLSLTSLHTYPPD